MKLTRGKKKNDRSIVSILILSLVVLTVSIVVCMMHVLDLRKAFEERMMRQTYDEVQTLTDTIYDSLGKSLAMMEQAALLWEPAEGAEREKEIALLLSRCEQFKEFYQIVYVDGESGKLYGNKTYSDTLLKEQLSVFAERSSAMIRMSDKALAGSDGYMVLFMAPVYEDNQIVGRLVGMQSAEQVLSGRTGDILKDKGDIFLINQKGKIYAQNAELFGKITEEEIGKEERNLFVRLSAQAIDTYSKSSLTGIKGKLNKMSYAKASFVDMGGMTDYVEIRRIGVAEGIFVACVYPETIYTDAIQPVVFKSLLVCIVIISVMIAMLIYVWATSKQANDKISSLAYDDTITGGKNDNYFRDVASRVIWENDSIPYIVVRFDIVNFRYINEAYGHDRADILLRIVGEESARVFKGKEICTRMTADQFVLLAKNNKEFEEKCESMIKVINERSRDAGIMFPIRLKQGIYQIRKDDMDIGIIIDRANAARKTLTGDEKVLTVVYSDKIIGQMYKIDQIESEMESAMANGEFKVYIQPKWDIVHDRIYGGEALVRWIKADGTRVFPDEFIPVFEKNGFVEKLDMYMLEEVCKRQRNLIDENKTIYPISVNQSRMLIHSPEYVNQVAKILKRYRIPNGYIELEVTETVFLDERNIMIKTMNQLKKMDVQLSMDDFGSGYSSLNMLKDIPFDVMKIDREFFSESATSNTSILILRKIIEMAEGLGIRVLCEGVETEMQVELLRKLGCKYVQGYYYSKPIPAEEFIEKYCQEMDNGKTYYDTLYQEECEAREKRELMEAEAVKAQSASSAVEKFKKTYAAPAESKRKAAEETGQRKLSTEEQKALAHMEREARYANKAKLSEDVGRDTANSR